MVELPPGRTFVLRIQDGGTVLIENVRTRSLVRVDDLGEVAGRIAAWLAGDHEGERPDEALEDEAQRAFGERPHLA